jgi:hypothetical protein
MILIFRKIIIIIILSFPLFTQNLLANIGTDTLIVDSVNFSIISNKVGIEYNISNPLDQKCQVTLILKRDSDTNFLFRPVSMNGSIGEGYFNGKKQKIIWEIEKDKPDWFKGQDYYFEISVKPIITSGGISPLIWIGGGALVLGSGAAILLLSKKESTQQEILMPEAPGRPK